MSDTSAIVLADEKTKLFTALNSYANALAQLSNEQVPAAFDMTDQLKDLAEEVRARLRDRLLLLVQAQGRTITDKGSMTTETGGFKVTAIPTRTGIDPKKLEAMLRRKSIALEKVMDATLTYKTNDAKLQDALGTQLLTLAEVKSCEFDKAFRVKVERDGA